MLLFLRNFLGIEFAIHKDSYSYNMLIIDLNLRLPHSRLYLRKIVVWVIIVQQLIANRDPEQSVSY